MDIQDRIRRLQSNVVRKRADDQRLSDVKSQQAAAMSEEEFTDAFKSQLQARDAKLMAKANVVTPGVNSSGVRPPAQQAARPAPQEDLATRAQKLLESYGPPPGKPRPQQGPAPMPMRKDAPRIPVDPTFGPQLDEELAQSGGAYGAERGQSDTVLMHRYLSGQGTPIDREYSGGPRVDRMPTPSQTGLSNKDYTESTPFRRALAARNATLAAPPAAAPAARDTHTERVGQLTEAGLTPAEAARVAADEHRIHGGVSPQLSDANHTPEAKAERARRIEGMRRTEARQDNFARSQLGGYLTGREAFEARAQQEGLRPAPAAKPQGWQPISQEDFTERAAGYGLSPEEAARAYGERPKATPANPHLGMSNAQQAQESRREAEWLKTMPGVHRKAATNDQAQYGDGTPADKITPEQYEARIERRNQERAALDPEFAAKRQLEKLAKASGKTPGEVEKDMFPTGRPQPSEAFQERQAARKAQHARANEAMWERKGYTGHLDEKTRSADAATVREGLSRLGQITGNPMYKDRLAALDAEDAAKGEHTRGMEKLTAEQQQALLMQNDAQAATENLEILGQKGAKAARDDQAVELDKGRKHDSMEKAADRGQALSVLEINQKHQLEQMEKQRELSKGEADQLSLLRQKEATHAAEIAEAKAAKDAKRQLTQTNAEGDAAVRVKQAERAAAGTPQSTANGYADEAFANPALSMGNSRNEMAAQLRSNHPQLSEDQALELATSTLRRRALMNAAGGSMHPGVRSHLTNEMKRLGDDGKPTVDAGGKPSTPMTQEEFRAYADTHAGMSPEQADAVYNDLNGVTSSAGKAELPPVPAGRVGPPRPSGTRRSGGAWRMPTPEEIEKERADRKQAAEDASKRQRKHPYSKE